MSQLDKAIDMQMDLAALMASIADGRTGDAKAQVLRLVEQAIRLMADMGMGEELIHLAKEARWRAGGDLVTDIRSDPPSPLGP